MDTTTLDPFRAPASSLLRATQRPPRTRSARRAARGTTRRTLERFSVPQPSRSEANHEYRDDYPVLTDDDLRYDAITIRPVLRDSWEHRIDLLAGQSEQAHKHACERRDECSDSHHCVLHCCARFTTGHCPNVEYAGRTVAPRINAVGVSVGTLATGRCSNAASLGLSAYASRLASSWLVGVQHT